MCNSNRKFSNNQQVKEESKVNQDAEKLFDKM